MRFEELEGWICQLWVDAVFGFSRIIPVRHKQCLAWVFQAPGTRGKADRLQRDVCVLSCLLVYGFRTLRWPTEVANTGGITRQLNL
jgi:hypothetical protein